MKTTPLRLLPLLVSLCLPLAACKKTAPAPDATDTQATAQASASGATPAAATPAPAGSTTAASAAPEKPFDFSTVPEVTGNIPPFPYVDYPKGLHEAFQSTWTVPMDRAYVILGDQLHAVEGRVATRTFAPRDADMSELEVRRNYENVMKELGAVKVNTIGPYEAALYAGRDEYDTRKNKLLVPDLEMSYDVYLARKGDARHWIVLMTHKSTTRLLAIEEKPFAQTIGYEGSAATPVAASGAPPAAPQPVDIDALPVATTPLPPFPYLPLSAGAA